MNSRFYKTLGLGALLHATLFGLVLIPFVAAGTDQTYINNGIITGQPPQVDAVNFVNYGSFGTAFNPIVTTDPFMTASTLNFTNQAQPGKAGVMYGSIGWNFDWEPISAGIPHMAASFFNLGRIEAVDSLIPSITVGEPFVSIYQPSKLFVSATNIINHGAMAVGPNGWLKLNGTNVDVSNGTLQAHPILDDANGSFNGQDSGVAGYFQPDVGISDVWWAQTNMNFDSAILWDGSVAATPVHSAVGPALNWTIQLALFNPVADSYVAFQGFSRVTITNMDATTNTVLLLSNVVKQAVFVGTPAGMAVQIGFTPSSSPTNLFQTADVLLSVSATNVATTLPETQNIYVRDQLASEVGRGLLQNLITPLAFRPTNYIVSRLNQGLGPPNNQYPEPDFFLNSGNFTNSDVGSDSVTNSRVTAAAYAAYGAFFDSNVSEPAAIPSGTVTNLPGRVHVFGKTLRMDKTRIRGEGEVIINTPHLISSSNAIIDCENLSFNIGSTNGLLTVQSLAKDSVTRTKGYVFLWSGLWANTVQVIITNNFMITNSVDNSDPSNIVTNVVATLSPVTNNISVRYHMLMVDASRVQTVVPVNVYDFTTHSTNVVVDDNMRLVQNFLMDGQSFTLNGSMTFSSATLPSVINPNTGGVTVSLSDWTFANAPNLLYFTNNGTLSIPNEAHFGDDRLVPYSTFMNTGTISAASISLNSLVFQNGGNLIAQGPVFLQGGAGKLESGSTSAGGVAWFTCDTLKFDHHELFADGPGYFDVANALFDAGPVSSNTFQFKDGFNLLTKPATGDLLGTAFTSLATTSVTPSPVIDHTWAGENRGADKSGYLNNVAIGRLTLSSASLDPTFIFSGAGVPGVTNGLYVDLLDLSALTNHYQSWIQIDPDLVIYFAAAKLGFTPPLTNGVAQEPEEYLDGQFGGHLRWVRNFAGPNSSVAVVSNSVSILVNSALRFSKIIDSDGDGIPNFYDLTPFGTGSATLIASITKTNQPPQKFAISWNAASNTVYRVEFTTNPIMNWQLLLKFTNAVSTNQTATVWDTNALTGGARRFYRIGYGP